MAHIFFQTLTTFLKILLLLHKMLSDDITEKQYNLLKIPLLVINSVFITFFITLILISSILLDKNSLINDSDVETYELCQDQNEAEFRLNLYRQINFCDKITLFLIVVYSYYTFRHYKIKLKKDNFDDLASFLSATRNEKNPEAFEYIIIREPVYTDNPNLAEMTNVDLSESW